MEALQEILSQINFNKVLNINFCNSSGDMEFSKILGKRIVLKGNDSFQFEKRKDNKVFHENICIAELREKIVDYMNFGFKELHIADENFEYLIRINKSKKYNFSKKSIEFSKPTNLSHNNEKNYLLKENTIIPPLIDLGVFTKEGKVVNSMYDKFKQINRFLEMVDDVVKKMENKQVNIIDFGCGKSYLTFIVYYYLEKILGLNVNIVGLDLKEDVIDNCNDIAKKYGYSNLQFEIGDINGYKPKIAVDIVISLHACDVATDFVLFNAIKWNSKAILSVPCCQHELNSQIKSEKFSIVCKYGIVQERIAALFTDIIRANLLIVCGYNVQMLEFVDLSHSPKNILIRANKVALSENKKNSALLEVQSLISEYNLSPKLYNLLLDEKLI